MYWASAGRSKASAARAAEAGLTDAGTVAELCRICEMIVSICPPEFAEATARQVAGYGFRGLYLDANAVSPRRAAWIAECVTAGGADFVDGGIIGLPARERGKTWLCLSGPRAADAAACFKEGPLEVTLLGDDPVRASTLKMCYAAYNKGAIAMLMAVLGAASRLGVLDELRQQWSHQNLNWDREVVKIERAAPKAWRWAPEMREIAETLAGAGMTPGFHEAAAELYARLAGFKDAKGLELADVLAGLDIGRAQLTAAAVPGEPADLY